MTLEQMKMYIVSVYPAGYINGKGGNMVHVSKAGNSHLCAAYYGIKAQQEKKKMRAEKVRLNKQNQYVFNF